MPSVAADDLWDGNLIFPGWTKLFFFLKKEDNPTMHIAFYYQDHSLK
jgi:hypothetical protein